MVSEVAARKPSFRGRTIYYSAPKLKLSADALGGRHYSYNFALDKFARALGSSEAECVELPLPEYYSSASALPESRSASEAEGAPILHLIFRSTEEIRLLKFAYNIACFAWEFDILQSETQRDGNILENQVHMLSLCDEIWVPCSYTKEILARHGLSRVEVVPAPVRVHDRRSAGPRDSLAALISVAAVPINHNPQWSREDSVRANGGAVRPLYEWVQNKTSDPRIFVSVLNPEDHRKNLNSMLRGFHYYQQSNPNSILLVKLVTSLKRHNLDPREMVYRLLANKLTDVGILQSPAILFIFDFLREESMDALYRAADFYLCTSIAEGQNLPMLEAMSHGAIPISPRHTAMLDYLDDENSIAIASRRARNFYPHIAPASFNRPFDIDYSDERDVFEALEAAGRLSDQQRREMSGAAIASVERQYGPAIVIKKIADRLEAIDMKSNGAAA